MTDLKLVIGLLGTSITSDAIAAYMMTVGISNEKRLKVTEQDTAEAWGSGTLPVLATPRMIQLIEQTACECAAPFMEEGDTTVGTSMEIQHVSPSPVGSEVVCRVTVCEVDRARMRFAVSVRDSKGDVGTGYHERFRVHSDRFMEKAEAKLA